MLTNVQECIGDPLLMNNYIKIAQASLTGRLDSLIGKDPCSGLKKITNFAICKFDLPWLLNSVVRLYSSVIATVLT